MYNFFQKQSKAWHSFRTLLSGNTFWCRVIFLSLVNLLTFRQKTVEFGFLEQEMTFFKYQIPGSTDLFRHALWKKLTTADCHFSSQKSWVQFFKMWQEILAIDSKFNDRRMMEAKDLRPLYLKRRLQLLQGQTNSQSRKVNKPEIECSDPDQYVMRNKKYISLRVKLLKKQFGLPSDLTSLR